MLGRRTAGGRARAVPSLHALARRDLSKILQDVDAVSRRCAARRRRRLGVRVLCNARPAVAPGHTLAEISPAPLRRTFLCDSGSVAVEIAIKMALQYWRARGVQGRHRLLTVRGGYHGDTFGAMSVCDPVNGMHAAMFAGALAQQIFVPRPRGR